MHPSLENIDVVNVRLTHKTAHVPLLEAVAFKNGEDAYTQLRMLDGVQESVVIQTCNRIELVMVSKNGAQTAQTAAVYLANRAQTAFPTASSAIETSVNGAAVDHLLRVTSGLESMVIGEDQVINQVWDAYLQAEKANATGPVLKHLFNRAVTIGHRVRRETGINKGAVSVGSAAVELAESLLGSFDGKKILVMGAGETGTLVAKAMARRCLSPIFIANRTYDRAVRLAEELSGQAVKFDKLSEVLTDADVVFCSTSAPHYLLTKELVAKLISQRQNKNNLLIIDISNPRNVEKAVEELPNVKLYNIDDLQLIADKNKQERQNSAQEAAKIIQEERALLERSLKVESVRSVISDLLSQTEEVRQRELVKALNMMGDLDEHQKKVVADLTAILLKQTFLPVIENLRKAAAENDTELVEVAIRLLTQKSN
jgi:glutamyl-tRNA reductase